MCRTHIERAQTKHASWKMWFPRQLDIGNHAHNVATWKTTVCVVKLSYAFIAQPNELFMCVKANRRHTNCISSIGRNRTYRKKRRTNRSTSLKYIRKCDGSCHIKMLRNRNVARISIIVVFVRVQTHPIRHNLVMAGPCYSYCHLWNHTLWAHKI